MSSDSSQYFTTASLVALAVMVSALKYNNSKGRIAAGKTRSLLILCSNGSPVITFACKEERITAATDGYA